MCEILNSYFGSVFASEIVNNDLPEVRNMFVEHNNFLVENADILSIPLLYIYRKSLESGIVPGKNQMLRLFSRRGINHYRLIIALLF